MSKIFITGGTGCIGASAIHKLLTNYDSEIESIIIVSRTGDPKLMKIWLGDSIDELVHSGKLQFVSVDIGDSAALEKALQEHQPDRIMHLGALQSPDCDSTPAKGVEINVLGTLNLFAAVEKLETKVERFVFASSAAVYGKRSMYSGDIVGEAETLAPPTTTAYGKLLANIWRLCFTNVAESQPFPCDSTPPSDQVAIVEKLRRRPWHSNQSLRDRKTVQQSRFACLTRVAKTIITWKTSEHILLAFA